MQTTPIPVTPCPKCGAEMSAASAHGPAVPQPGDYLICWYCACVCRFDAALQLVAVPLDEPVPISVAQAQRQLIAYRSRRVH